MNCVCHTKKIGVSYYRFQEEKGVLLFLHRFSSTSLLKKKSSTAFFERKMKRVGFKIFGTFSLFVYYKFWFSLCEEWKELKRVRPSKNYSLYCIVPLTKPHKKPFIGALPMTRFESYTQKILIRSGCTIIVTITAFNPLI